MDFNDSARTESMRSQLVQFMDEHIYPNEARFQAKIDANTQAGGGRLWS